MSLAVNQTAPGLRPVITLISDIEITGGNGTEESPWTVLTN